MEEIISEEQKWDKKKIIGAVLSLMIVGVGVKTFVLDARKEALDLSPEVKGVKVEQLGSLDHQPTPTIPQSFNPQKILQDKLEAIKAEVQNINIAEIASSSPQVQKALNDLKALEQYPRNQAKEICQKICSSF